MVPATCVLALGGARGGNGGGFWVAQLMHVERLLDMIDLGYGIYRQEHL